MDLSILSVPTHKRMGMCLKVSGDDPDGIDPSVQPYLHARKQVVAGIEGAVLESLVDNGPEFRGVETSSSPRSNMMLLEVLEPQEVKRGSV